jgi:hypothetical protein
MGVDVLWNGMVSVSPGRVSLLHCFSKLIFTHLTLAILVGLKVVSCFPESYKVVRQARCSGRAY